MMSLMTILKMLIEAIMQLPSQNDSLQAIDTQVPGRVTEEKDDDNTDENCCQVHLIGWWTVSVGPHMSIPDQSEISIL